VAHRPPRRKHHNPPEKMNVCREKEEDWSLERERRV